jgi:energy-coupling factor transporter ATP-binding protein EcfA2
VDLIDLGTINERIAAYFWLVLENRLTVMTMGGTGAGKTTLLNALANLFKKPFKKFCKGRVVGFLSSIATFGDGCDLGDICVYHCLSNNRPTKDRNMDCIFPKNKPMYGLSIIYKGIIHLCFIPFLKEYPRLAEYFFEEAQINITQMRIWNSDFMTSFNHELVLSA